jgi:hypothetical protein
MNSGKIILMCLQLWDEFCLIFLKNIQLTEKEFWVQNVCFIFLYSSISYFLV